jgi:hypothetical protein
MVFKKDTLEIILRTMQNKDPIYFHIGLKPYDFCTHETWNEPNTADFIIKDYEAYFNTPFNKNTEYPLWNSYILPIKLYNKIMPWVIQLYPKLYPWCIESPNKMHFGHIGGIYERIMAYAIGQEIIDNLVLDINHNHALKNKSY